jgi:tRNA(Ile)-lysidine synthase
VSDRIDFLNALSAGYANCECHGPENGLLLAVSGGADSMSLLHGTRQLWPDGNGQIVVAHVNHQLRGSESAADAEFVREAAKSQGLRFILLTCDVPKQREAVRGGIEEVARRNRYRLLQDAALANGLGDVVCGHHQEDQAETVLHNILRGTGMKGLAGMSARRLLCEDVQLIRPLLSISRAAVVDFLHARQVSWQTDASNESPEFTRNRIRQQLLPLLAEEYNPQIARSLIRLAGHARDVNTLASQVGQRCLDDVVLELQRGICRLNRTRLAVWPQSVVRSALRLIWDYQSWPQQAMTQAHWHHLAADLQDTNGKPGDVPGVDISTTKTIVRIFRTA